MNQEPESNPVTDLRTRAQEYLRDRAAAPNQPRSEEEARRLVHELQIHQIELQLQNEELREAQHRLEESLEHFAAFYDFAPIGFVTFDAKGVIREVNRTAVEMLGAPKAQLTGKPFHPFVAAVDLPRFLVHLRPDSSPEEQIGSEFHLTRPGHQDLPVIMRSVIVVGGEKADPIFRATLTDISTRKRFEVELAEQRDFLSAVLDTSGALIIVLDPTGRVIGFNQACEQASGYRAEEVLGKPLWNLLLPPEQVDRVRTVFDQMTKELIPCRYENHWRTKSASLRLISWANTVLKTGEGEVRAIIGSGLDITERRQLEAEVLEIGDRAKRQIGMDLHDGLGQKLTGLSLLSRNLQNNLAEYPKLARQAETLGEHLRDAIRHTRALSHGLAPFELADEGLYNALLKMASSITSVSGVPCTFDCPEMVLIKDRVVAGHLYHIAQEAVNNALKHSGTPRVEIQLNSIHGTVRLKITDHGTGLPESPAPGEGRGMAILKYRADLIGGTLHIRSQPGQGMSVECVVVLSD
jgi:PAS domain S-box-containing protein